MIAFANNYKNCLYLQPTSPTQTNITYSIYNFQFLFYNTRRVVQQFQEPVINILIEEQQSQQKHENDINDGYDS